MTICTCFFNNVLGDIMQYLLIILINIFMWAIFYLVISLKLEKSASHFRERKFREEMDRLMTEFNSAADRNISLLENRISLLKKLLERTGNLDSIDLTLGQGEKKDTEKADLNVKEKGSSGSHERVSIDLTESAAHERPVFLNKGSKSIKLITRKFNHLMERLKNFAPEKNNTVGRRFSEYDEVHEEQNSDSRRGSMVDMVLERGSVAELIKENELPDSVNSLSSEEDREFLGDEEILQMFSQSDDKFTVISQLFSMGYSIEKISQCSGMPAGEVKLVLNLNEPAG